MNTCELIMKAMKPAKLNSEQLAAKADVSLYTIGQLMKNNQEVSIYALEKVLKSLGYQLTAVESKQ
mgnify:FL=1